MSLLSIALILYVTSPSSAGYSFFSNSLQEQSIQIHYAHDPQSDKITNECLLEMYPKTMYKYPIQVDRNDVPCILHCVLKKFGIMNNSGDVNLVNYYKRVEAIHRFDPRILISDVGETCALNLKRMNLDHDVCRKAKVFNDCTQLYVISVKKLDDEIS